MALATFTALVWPQRQAPRVAADALAVSFLLHRRRHDLIAIVGTRAVRRFYRAHEKLIVRCSGVLFMGFAVQALTALSRRAGIFFGVAQGLRPAPETGRPGSRWIGRQRRDNVDSSVFVSGAPIGTGDPQLSPVIVWEVEAGAVGNVGEIENVARGIDGAHRQRLGNRRIGVLVERTRCRSPDALCCAIGWR